jgi:hypothetical protein
MRDLPGAIRVVVALLALCAIAACSRDVPRSVELAAVNVSSPVPTSQVPTVIPTAAPTVTSTSTLIPPSPTIASSATSTSTPVSPTPVEPSPTRAPATATTAPSVVTPGSAKPAGRGVPAAGRGACPATHPIKGNRGSRSTTEWIYHVPGGGSYAQTDPEECFAGEADAQAAGYRRARN